MAWRCLDRNSEERQERLGVTRCGAKVNGWEIHASDAIGMGYPPLGPKVLGGVSFNAWHVV